MSRDDKDLLEWYYDFLFEHFIYEATYEFFMELTRPKRPEEEWYDATFEDYVDSMPEEEEEIEEDRTAFNYEEVEAWLDKLLEQRREQRLRKRPSPIKRGIRALCEMAKKLRGGSKSRLSGTR